MIWQRIRSLLSGLVYGRRSAHQTEGAWAVHTESRINKLPVGIIVLSATVIAMLWAALIYDSGRAHDSAIRQSTRDADNLVVAFREHIYRTVGAVDQLMVAVAADHAMHPDRFQIPSWVPVSPLLKGILVQVALTDRDGIVRASNLPVNGRIDLSDRPHFRYHLDPTAPQPYISVPVVGRVSNKPSIQFTRRLMRDGSVFDGVMTVSIDPQYFSSSFDSVNLGQKGIAVLIGLDGIIRARRANMATDVGQDVSRSPLFRHLSIAKSGTYVAPSGVDHVERIVSYTTVPDYPLVVMVGIATDDALAGWYRVKPLTFIGGGALTLIIAALTWFIVRETRRRQQAERKRHEDSFRLLFEGNPVPMWLVDLGTMKYLAVNDAALAHYGYTRDQFLSMGVYDIRPPEDREEIKRAFWSWDARDNIRSWRHLKADGSIIDVMVYRRLLTYEGRRASLVAVLDVTERLRVEAERDRNRDFLDRIIEAVPATIYVKDARDLCYILVNRAAEQQWGLARDEIIGKTAYDLFDKETADRIARVDCEALQSNTEISLPAHAVRMPNGGARVITGKRLGIRGPDGNPQYILGVVEDVTEQKATEEQLRQALKMEAVGKLTGGVAHDFNNLLTVIIGNLDLLQIEIADNPSAAQKVEAILQASERGAELTRQMLAFSRRQPLQPKQVDLNRLVGDTMRLLSRTLGEAITVDVQVAADAGVVFVDAQQLETALVNIAINARDAMPTGGTLTVATRRTELDAGHPALPPGAPAGTFAIIEITDNGSGMPPEVLERIFEPFFTTKPVGKGTGLGLSMVYGFMKQSGGHISAYSEVGRGTTFRLYLPARPQESDQPATGQPAAAEPGGATGDVILAVDDNTAVRETVVLQLKALGYAVREADSAQVALQILGSRDRIDLLFTDIVMPGGMNGKELATQARLKRPGLKVLFTSGFPQTSPASGAEFASDDVLLSKPYRRQDLARALKGVLAH